MKEQNIVTGKDWRKFLRPICWVIGHRKTNRKGHNTIEFEGCKICHTVFSWW